MKPAETRPIGSDDSAFTVLDPLPITWPPTRPRTVPCPTCRYRVGVPMRARVIRRKKVNVGAARDESRRMTTGRFGDSALTQTLTVLPVLPDRSGAQTGRKPPCAMV